MQIKLRKKSLNKLKMMGKNPTYLVVKPKPKFLKDSKTNVKTKSMKEHYSMKPSVSMSKNSM